MAIAGGDAGGRLRCGGGDQDEACDAGHCGVRGVCLCGGDDVDEHKYGDGNLPERT